MNSPNFTTVHFSVSDFECMIDAGVFVGKTGRIELIEGELRQMSPASDGHDDLIVLLTTWSHRVVRDHYQVAVQIGLRLLKTESRPEPDLYWIESRHRRGRATAAVVPLVIEISMSSLKYDLDTKRRIFARDGVAEYWVVDGQSQSVIVHRQPSGEGYAQIQVFKHPEQPAPQCLPQATIDLDWLFNS